MKNYNLNLISGGQLVYFTIFSHAQLAQSVSILDSNNNPVKFTKLAGDYSQFPVNGNFSKPANLQLISSGYFWAPEGLQVSFELCSNFDVTHTSFISSDNEERGGTYVFGVSDGGSGLDSLANVTLMIRWEDQQLGE